MPKLIPKKALNDRGLASLKPAKPGKRVDVWDARCPGLGIRITDTGHKSFVFVARYPGAVHPTRRAIGAYPAMSLARARQKATEWRELIESGKNPAVVEADRRAAEARRKANTFARVAEDFIAAKLPQERKGKVVERDIRSHFMAPWGSRPISEITDEDVVEVIAAKAVTAPSHARNLLGHIKRLFSWAAAPTRRKAYGVSVSPCVGIRPTDIDGIGEKKTGDRLLTDAELFALDRVHRRMGYPYGPVYKLLVLTGLRLNEVADAHWSEFDLAKNEWTLPASRMKGKNGKARPHLVPLTDEVMSVLTALPRFSGGGYLFSTTFGASPVWISDKVKRRVDARMLRTLRALARRSGDDASKVTLAHWTNHDIRRTVRSGLSRLKVAEETREAVLAHVRPGIKKNYDLHDYRDEKREALTLWAARVRDLGTASSPNVIRYRAAANA